MIGPDKIFVAITGFRQDGNRWVDDAIERGAVAVVTEKRSDRPVPQVIVPDARAALADLAAKFYGRNGSGTNLIAVTGTNGKTTTCFLIRNIMETDGEKSGLITSLIYDDGSEQIPARRTTPESLDIYRLLSQMKNNGIGRAVIEVSSHALVLHRVRNLDFTLAVFTNISRDHLDFHADMEDYLKAKERLLDMVADDNKKAVINLDCPEFRPFIDKARCEVVTYSLEDKEADVHLENYKLKPQGSEFELHGFGHSRRINLKLTGRFNLYNALAAAAASLAYGIDIDRVAAGLEKSDVIPGRLERIDSEAPFTIFLDYAHTPDALTRTIETLKEIGSGKVLVMFGCGGDRDRGKRPLMGEAVSSAADYAVLTSDNPRTEAPARIMNDVKPGLVPGIEVDLIEDRRRAIEHIIERAGKGDIVLLAGKGAENYQEINGVRHPFSDRDIALEKLKQLGYGT